VPKAREKSYAQRCLEEAFERGLALAEPQCDYFGECGGCAWQPIAYERQLEFKRAWVEQALAAHGLGDVPVPTPVASPDLYRYRNKMEFSFSAHRWFTRREIESGETLSRRFALGLHAAGAFDRVLDIAACPLQSDAANAYLAATRDFARTSHRPPYHARARHGFFRYLVLRRGIHTGQSLILLVTTARDSDLMQDYVAHLNIAGLKPTTVCNGVTDRPASTSEGCRIHVDAGEGRIEERILDWVFDLGPDTFFQPNTRGAERLCEVVGDLAGLTGREAVLDLYCGVGVLALCVSPKAREVYGVEHAEGAVEMARVNAAKNGVENVRFLAADLDKGLPSPLTLLDVDVVIADPPRAGMHANTVRALRDLAPPRIVSVGCHPLGQARNIADLCARGEYFLAEVQPVDLFPHTPHIENVALLVRP
jgi:23S rRNA (uracil1939-C5)-methyltransferase